ncbi:MAG: branched-chain-amino-acid transaminase [Chloroflexi bacterium]|nr:branched-chain-amino-acid transaminase [Chloroflexota bacterium]
MPDKQPRLILFNGEILEYDQARVHVNIPALGFAANVIESLRGYWNATKQELYIFRLKDHLHRLVQTMNLCKIPGHGDIHRYAEDVLRIVRAGEFREDIQIVIKALIEKPDGTLLAVNPTEPATVVMFARPMGRMVQAEGMHCQISSWIRPSDHSMPLRAKAAANYHNSRLAEYQARIDGYDTAILLNSQGNVTEGTAYNIFMVRHGALITPPVTDGILEGVTRDTLITLASRKMGLSVQERSIDRTELYVADELFFCGSAAEVTPILSVDRQQIGNGETGPLTGRTRESYFSIVRGEVADELKWLTPVTNR